MYTSFLWVLNAKTFYKTFPCYINQETTFIPLFTLACLHFETQSHVAPADTKLTSIVDAGIGLLILPSAGLIDTHHHTWLYVSAILYFCSGCQVREFCFGVRFQWIRIIILKTVILLSVNFQRMRSLKTLLSSAETERLDGCVQVREGVTFNEGESTTLLGHMSGKGRNMGRREQKFRRVF